MNPAMALIAATPEHLPAAEQLSSQLDFPCLGVTDPREIGDFSQVLRCGERLELCATGRQAPGPVAVDFVGGALAHRRRFGGGRAQPVARAIGLRPGFYPRVLDATAGLGRDAFVLATLGCEVWMLERNPVVRLLLQDGLRRLHQAAAADTELVPAAGRLCLVDDTISAVDWLTQQDEDSWQVVYLDPMFPLGGKSAKVKKEMAAFHYLVGVDKDADQLLEPAFKACYYRTVVKRPRLAPCLAGKNPSLLLQGKSGRFDIYTKHGIPS
ncbi:class I SAM-dependent methyltransferase [Microbulbifer spongiae]|uniref:Ribosomal RNA small subunit methyltransferase J n=1 Tax=Microbulbifer spongiae TaxID=2944933 RepID=A0ABY9E7H0_9GAMM|nr:class I SAM-dependent methyltransferase [Microbulbifer sp. MI-G]WKD48281.1 class I SAM-dependent methyltransferase [Microbulbifer sp. MI-G]